MSKIKLVALDIDGTLLDNDGNISLENKIAIGKMKDLGIEVVLCTARFISNISDVINYLGLNSYYVTVNGSEIWNGMDQLIDRTIIPYKWVEELIRLGYENNIKFWATTTNFQYSYNDIPADIYQYQWLSFEFSIIDKVKREIIWEMLTKIDQLEISNSNFTNIEVNAKGVNKSEGLKKICLEKGITMQNICAIGDSLNDISMIQNAGLGIAMENAQEIVKKSADWVTTSNSESGVGRALQHWVLEGRM